MFRGVPGEDFELENSSLQPEMRENRLQRGKQRKIDIGTGANYIHHHRPRVFYTTDGPRKKSDDGNPHEKWSVRWRWKWVSFRFGHCAIGVEQRDASPGSKRFERKV